MSKIPAHSSLYTNVCQFVGISIGMFVSLTICLLFISDAAYSLGKNKFRTAAKINLESIFDQAYKISYRYRSRFRYENDFILHSNQTQNKKFLKTD